MNNISFIAKEIAEEFQAISGRRITSVEEYMQLRNQAMKELETGFGQLAPDQTIVSNPVKDVPFNLNSQPIKEVKNTNSSEKSRTVSHYNSKEETSKKEKVQTPVKDEQPTDVRNTNNFLECVNRIKD